jgi:hypothetical protein
MSDTVNESNRTRAQTGSDGHSTGQQREAIHVAIVIPSAARDLHFVPALTVIDRVSLDVSALKLHSFFAE